MIEAVTQEVEIRRDAAFVLGALEHVEDVPRCPGEDVKAVGFTACEQEEQRTVEQVVHEPQSRQEAFGVRVVPRERVKQHTAEQGVPQLREETVEAVSSIPCERVQQQAVKGMAGEQSEVTEVTETASQDRNLQRALDQTPWTLSELSKLSLRCEFLKGCGNTSASSKCPRTQGRKVSR